MVPFPPFIQWAWMKKNTLHTLSDSYEVWVVGSRRAVGDESVETRRHGP